MSAPRAIVVTGPSGVGKGTLIERLLKEFPERFAFSVSSTTRGPRPGEENGVHYHFLEIENMKTRIANDEFLEHAEVHGNFYGTSKSAVADVIAAGKSCILDIDVQGAKSVNKANIGASFVFIEPPSMDALESRLRGRGTETEEKVLLRLNNAKKELAEAKTLPFFEGKFIVNDDLEKSYSKFKEACL